MTIRASILQGVRGWLKMAATLTDAQVIPADDVGPRPPLPYLTVRVIAPDLPVGEDEVVWALDEDDLPTATVHGTRRATISVQGFGAGVEEWLSVARLALSSDAGIAQLNAAGINLIPSGSPRDISRLLETAIEYRVIWDLEAIFNLSSAPESLVAALTAETTIIVQSDGDPFTVISEFALE